MNKKFYRLTGLESISLKSIAKIIQISNTYYKDDIIWIKSGKCISNSLLIVILDRLKIYKLLDKNL